MLFKKKKNELNDNSEKENFTSLNLIEKPKICLFNIEDKYAEILKNNNFNIYSGSLGLPIKVPNNNKYDRHLCLLNHEIPKNLHEYDIIVIDLEPKNLIDYKLEENQHQFQKSNKALYFISEFPQTIFDPLPISTHLLKRDIDFHLNKKSILIIFSSKLEKWDYNVAVMRNQGYEIDSIEKFNNYSFISGLPIKQNRAGKDINITIKRSDIRALLETNQKEFYYNIVFNHPTSWKGDEKVKDENFIPLITNPHDEVVSFVQFEEKSMVMVFPQIADKSKILLPLLKTILPDVFADIFPHSELFSWIKRSDYFLPYHKHYLDKKEDLENKYEEKLELLDKEIEANKLKYKFLHDMLIETDNELVRAVKDFLAWLGFQNIIIMDEENKVLKEEDLQIETDIGLLVIEIKGIGGTSKDSDCSQINKIKYRRAKERGKFDVYGIYIVNHQRYIEPLKRENPPFTENQISDAANEERGLLTTWQLFNLFFLVENDIISKDDARKRFVNYGHISFFPDNTVCLGKTSELFKDGKVFILNIKDIKIALKDFLLIKNNNELIKTKILNLQVNDKNVEEVENGEIGIEVETAIRKNSEIYLMR